MTSGRTPKRGEMYYIRYDWSVGAETAVGRPAVVVSSDLGNRTSPVYNVLFSTTTPRGGNMGVNVTTPRKGGYILCNQIHTFDGVRFGDYMCTLTEEEMGRIDQALATALGLKLSNESEIHSLKEDYEERLEEALDLNRDMKVELDYYKKLYEKALNLKVDAKLAADTVVAEEQPVAEVKQPEEEEEQPVDVNQCGLYDLTRLGLNVGLAKMVIAGRPYETKDDLRFVPGMTRIAFGLIENRVMVGDFPPQKSGKVNVNRCTHQDLMNLGMSKDVAYGITGYRNKNGKYQKLDDLLNVKRFTENQMKKFGSRLEV